MITTYKISFILFLLSYSCDALCVNTNGYLISKGILSKNYQEMSKVIIQNNKVDTHLSIQQNNTLLNNKRILSELESFNYDGLLKEDALLLPNISISSVYDPTFYTLYLEVVLWINNEIKVITARVKPIYNSYKAHLKSIEISAKQISKQIGEMTAIQVKLDSINILQKTVYDDGHEFRIGGLAPNACFRAEQGRAINDVLHSVYPILSELNVELKNHITNISETKYVIYSDLNKLQQSPVSPFFGSEVSDSANLAIAIKNIVNPKTFTIRAGRTMHFNSSDFVAEELRYELLVKTIQGVILQFAQFNMQSPDGNSNKLQLTSLYATAVSNNANKSVSIKNVKGNLNELNETFSNFIKIETDSSKLDNNYNALLAVMASTYIDSFKVRL
ncbi:MAG: hypothetical protein QM504_03370 [Pseudomonadota bacterium]